MSSGERSLMSRILSVGFGIVLLLGIVGLVVFVVAPIPATTGLTEFYVLGSDGQAGNYSNATVGEPKRLTVGVENQEHERVTYRFVAERNGTEIASERFALGDGETWTKELSLTFDSAGRKQVDLLLYRGDDREPYRELFVKLSVSDDYR